MRLDDLTWSDRSRMLGDKMLDLEFADFGDADKFSVARNGDKTWYWFWVPSRNIHWECYDQLEAQCFLYEYLDYLSDSQRDIPA